MEIVFGARGHDPQSGTRYAMESSVATFQTTHKDTLSCRPSLKHWNLCSALFGAIYVSWWETQKPTS